jgi:hypothetical protein
VIFGEWEPGEEFCEKRIVMKLVEQNPEFFREFRFYGPVFAENERRCAEEPENKVSFFPEIIAENGENLNMK